MLAGMRIDAIEARILGSLVEKQLTTPQQYPLSLNSLTLACNQSSNRDPIVSYDEGTVEGGLATMKEKGLVRFVLPSHGRSVVRYRHVLDERLALDQRQMALIAVLLLRGPQTVGELRVRTERMATFDGVADVESDLAGLTRGDDPFVARLERRPGQKEERWTQLLCLETAVELTMPMRADQSQVGPEPPHSLPESARFGEVRQVEPTAEVQELRDDIKALRDEVQALRDEVAELRAAILDL
jgi:uncharacterized protein YceH (UPF0502 family)